MLLNYYCFFKIRNQQKQTFSVSVKNLNSNCEMYNLSVFEKTEQVIRGRENYDKND